MNRKPHERILFLSAVLISLMILITAVGTVGTLIIKSGMDNVIKTDIPRLDHIMHVDRDLIHAQNSLQSAVIDSPDSREAHLRDFESKVADTAIRWNTYLQFTIGTAVELAQQGQYSTARATWLRSSRQLVQVVANAPGDDIPDIANLLAASRTDFGRMLAAIDALEDLGAEVTIQENSTLLTQESVMTMWTLIVLMIVGLAIGSITSLTTYRAAKRGYILDLERDQESTDHAIRSKFHYELDLALETAQTEQEALHTVQLVLDHEVPGRPTEMLLSDSSQAHLERVVHTDVGDEVCGCPVETPSKCPAIRRGASLSYLDGSTYSACINLRDRSCGPFSAICVPMSVAGRTIGVIHTTGPVMEEIDAVTVEIVERIAERSGDRIGVLRAFAKSQSQASTDPLTGLLNRRSFEDEASERLGRQEMLAIAYGDLDHFKLLNDTHGHDAGDRALRLFSRVVRDSLREADIAARWGGEEFVIMFAGSDTISASLALDRIRQNLLIALSSGSTPSFTVSFGVVDTNAGHNLEELISMADDALLSAKDKGRDRVVVAGVADDQPEERSSEEPYPRSPLTPAAEPSRSIGSV